MYHVVTVSTKILSSFFLAQRNSLRAFWYSRHPFFRFARALLTPHAILVSITRRLPKQQVAAVRPICARRDFDAISVLPGQFCPWTSQAACGSSQTFFHPFSRYYMSRASLSRCVTCTTVIHTDFWELVVRVLWEARTCSRQNRHDRDEYPFAGMASEHRLDNFKPDTQVIE